MSFIVSLMLSIIFLKNEQVQKAEKVLQIIQKNKVKEINKLYV